jgi:hypothetical protein
MISAVTHFCDGVVLLTPITSNQIKIWPNLPIYLFPTNSEGFTNKCYELLKIPISVDYMFCSHLTVSINTL